MSGGVDSSCVAVTFGAKAMTRGVTLQLYGHGEATHRRGRVPAPADIHDARRVARPSASAYVLDYEQRFATR